MTIKLFIFDAARVRETRTRWQKTCVIPSPMQIHVRSAFSKLLAPCHSTRIWYPATLSSIWPIQIHGYSDSRSFRRFFPSLVHDLRHCRQRRRVFFCNAPPRVPRTRRMSLPRNYFHMIPIARQIKIALSASRADREHRLRTVRCECDLSYEQNQIPGE